MSKTEITKDKIYLLESNGYVSYDNGQIFYKSIKHRQTDILNIGNTYVSFTGNQCVSEIKFFEPELNQVILTDKDITTIEESLILLRIMRQYFASEFFSIPITEYLVDGTFGVEKSLARGYLKIKKVVSQVGNVNFVRRFYLLERDRLYNNRLRYQKTKDITLDNADEVFKYINGLRTRLNIK